jgi:DNA-binding GntR family transcriptional regulator
MRADDLHKDLPAEHPALDPDAPLVDAVYQQLLGSIHQGRLPPGSVVNEAALALEFGVSRGPVREAVRRLQAIQLVTRQPYTKSRVMSLSSDAAQELFQLRMALEGMACNLATRRMPDAELDALLAELESSRHGGGAKALDFHERVVRACGNSRIINALCGDLYHLLRMYRRHSTIAATERKEDAYNEHWQILRAMKARDAALAESLMRSHIERAASNLVQKLGPIPPT